MRPQLVLSYPQVIYFKIEEEEEEEVICGVD